MIFLILMQKTWALSNNNDFYLQNSLLESKSYYFEKDNYNLFSLNLNAGLSKNIKSLIDEIDKDNEESLIKYVNNNLGKRHYLISNNFVKINIKDFYVSYNYFGYLALDLNNSIINEIDSTLLKKESVSLEKNFSLNKKIVEYKAEWHGKTFDTVYPKDTSRKCSRCGYIHKDNRNGKTFHCLKCSLVMDADLNAAINIREAGLALLACGDYHISDSMKQELEITLLV